MSRPITTLTRQLTSSPSVPVRSALAIGTTVWLENKRRYRRSLFLAPTTRIGRPQGLRRLRFSFFLFTFQRTRQKSREREVHRRARQLSLDRPRRRDVRPGRTPSRPASREPRVNLRAALKAAPPSCGAYIVVAFRECQHLVINRRADLRDSGDNREPPPAAIFAPQTALTSSTHAGGRFGRPRRCGAKPLH